MAAGEGTRYSPRQRARIHAGDCMDCAGPRGDSTSSVRCRSCAQETSRRSSVRTARLRVERGAAGLCAGCGAQRDGQWVTCAECRRKAKDSIARRRPAHQERKRASGLCRSCASPVVGVSTACAKHFITSNMGRRGVRSTGWEPYWHLLEGQNFQCWYSGEVLVPGRNASIDHRVPTSRGGDPIALDNLVWCTWDINRTKGALTDVEFVELCRRVLRLRG